MHKIVFASCYFLAALATIARAAEPLKITELTPLTAPVTAFGAAVAGNHLYVYGGHLGTTHKYSADEQSNQMLRLNLAQPDKWEVVGEVPRRTGLALVAWQDKLYRVGGWEARNAKGDKADLHSTADFARFDPVTGKWQDLTPLPTPRSSHDAAVLGSKLYVVGGWKLAGSQDEAWHESALVCDLAAESPQWKTIAAPGFNRRALAVAALGGKIYVIGGMDDSNDTTTDVSIYDPATDKWSAGPTVPGKSSDGFGASAFGTASGLYASTSPGTVFRLNADGKTWTEVGKLNHPRMSHRLLAVGEDRLVVVGGTSRGGKVREVESLQLKLASRP